MQSEEQSEKHEIVVSNAFSPVFDEKSIKAGFEAFNKAITAVLTKDDVVKIGDNTFVVKSGWNKLALFFGVSTRPAREPIRTNHDDGSFTWTVFVTAFKKDEVSGIDYAVSRSGSCNSHEKDYMDTGKTKHRKDADVYAMAETRGVGRATSAFFGSGQVSYEEIIGSDESDLKKAPVNDSPSGTYRKGMPCNCKEKKLEPQTKADFTCHRCGGDVPH